MEIKIGTKVFLRPTGNLARRYEVKEGSITKVGRKYFYVDDEKFELETLKNVNEDCNSEWILYFSMQEILDVNEKSKLLKKYMNYFNWSGSAKNLSLEKLKEIARIIGLDGY